MKISTQIKNAPRLVNAARPIPLDKSYAKKLANQLYVELLGKLKHTRPDRPLSVFLRAKDMTGKPIAYRSEYLLEYSEVTSPDLERVVPIVFVLCSEMSPGSMRQFICGGHVARLGSRGSRGSKVQLELQLADKDVEDYTSPQGKKGVVQELFSVLIHEMTHLIDVLEKLGDSTDSEDPSVYYNKPSELRAFLQQIVDEAQTFAQEHGPAPLTSLLPLALKNSPTWQRIEKALTPLNRKKVLKVVHDVLV